MLTGAWTELVALTDGIKVMKLMTILTEELTKHRNYNHTAMNNRDYPENQNQKPERMGSLFMFICLRNFTKGELCTLT